MLSSINHIRPYHAHTHSSHHQPRARYPPVSTPRTCAEENRQHIWLRSERQVPHSPSSGHKPCGSLGAGVPYDADGPTRLTNPTDIFPLSDSSLHKLSPSEIQSHAVETRIGLPLPPISNLLKDAASTTNARYSTSTYTNLREPPVSRIPRRRHRRGTKEREYIRERCLQELFRGSNVWIAFNPKFIEEGGKDEELTEEEVKELNWMWEGHRFTGVIRVWVDQQRRGYRKTKSTEGRGEELELVITRDQAKTHNDTGISALSDTQLETAATFLVENFRRSGGKGKILITVPTSRPCEALSIALLGLSLPTSSNSTSYLSQAEFLSGISELEARRQDIFGIDANESQYSRSIRRGSLSAHTFIQLAFWNLHDLALSDDDDDFDELRPEWRGSLSLDGIEKLEDVMKLSNNFWGLFR